MDYEETTTTNAPEQKFAEQKTTDLEDKSRFLASLVIDGNELSDQEAQFLYEDFLANRSRLIAMRDKTREKENKG